MLRRMLIITVLCLAAAGGPAGAQSELDLDLLWRRGQFAMARELIQANLDAGRTTPEFLADAARCAEGMLDYALAADLYARLADAVRADDEAYRAAREHEWRNRWQLEGSTSAQWYRDAQAELAAALAEVELTGSQRRRLPLELEYLLALVADEAAEPSPELREYHPNSDVVLRAAKAALDALAVEPDDAQRLALIERFLANYPDNYWRHFAWRYKLYTTWRMHQTQALVDSANAYLAEYPSQPESHGAVSRYLFEADLEPELGYASAVRSVELYETVLGLDGSAASLARLNASTAQEPPQPDHRPPGRRAMFLEYLGSRYNLGRYELVRGEYQAALELVEPLIALDPFTTEEEHTLAPFQLIAAQVKEADGDPLAAYHYYLAAACAGDSRNRYALQAEQQLPVVAEQLSDREVQEAWAQAVPAELAGIAIPRFTDVTDELGLKGAGGRRVAWGDVDLDGDPDLLLDGGRLWRNDVGTTATGGRFNDASRLWGLTGGAAGGVFGDLDNDGDLDLYSFAHGRQADKLWRNEMLSRSGSPSTRFVDITAVAGGPTDNYPSEGAAWLDYDNDGWLDLYVGNYEQGGTADELGAGTPDLLYHNLGGTRFEPADEAAGLIAPGLTLRPCRGAVAAADYDDDADQDLFVGNYRLTENYLWSNNGDGTLTNAARLAGVAGVNTDGWWGHTIGAAWGDVDNDSDLDLFTANLAHPRYAYFSDKSQLLISTQGILGTMFNDRRAQWGIRYEETHAGPVFLDANQDGWLDLYLTSTYEGRRSFLYLNDGHGRFHDVTFLAGCRVLAGWGAAWADFDGDGDLDLAVGSDGGVRLLRNDTAPGQWLVVRLSGGAGANPALSNAAAIGARVTLTTQNGVQVRELQSGSGTGSGNELCAHFGLGNATGVIRVRARFPSGAVVTRALKTGNQVVTLSELEAEPPQVEDAAGLIPARGDEGAATEGEAANADQADEDAEDEEGDELSRPTGTRGGG
ncbi:CRTAC1 family protein [bacterium]|nr:CRTAC1 family protein [bacterium]